MTSTDTPSSLAGARIRARLGALAMSAVFMSACSGSTEPQFVQADANSIRQRTQDFEAAFNSKEAAKVVAFYPAESVLMPPNAPTIRGKEGIERFYAELYAQGATDLEMDTKDVRGHGTLAYEAGGYTMNRKPAKGNAVRDRGKYLFIWRNNNGTWTIENTIWSSDLPEMVPIAN
jgi:uncharacterized protein (TIGR02246 family)